MIWSLRSRLTAIGLASLAVFTVAAAQEGRYIVLPIGPDTNVVVTGAGEGEGGSSGKQMRPHRHFAEQHHQQYASSSQPQQQEQHHTFSSQPQQQQQQQQQEPTTNMAPRIAPRDAPAAAPAAPAAAAVAAPAAAPGAAASPAVAPRAAAAGAPAAGTTGASPAGTTGSTSGASTGGASTSSTTGGAAGGQVVSKEEFTKAITACGYPAPSDVQYTAFSSNAAKDGGITTKREAAMFLAQILWESGGLKYKAEIACATSGCPGQYQAPGGAPGKTYYGRGYIQLTWVYNYKAASQALYGDDRLVQNPDQVATDETIAWQTAFWFWKTKVHSNPGVQAGQFGAATKVINGGLECGGNVSNGKAAKRFALYQKVLPAFGVNEAPNSSGC